MLAVKQDLLSPLKLQDGPYPKLLGVVFAFSVNKPPVSSKISELYMGLAARSRTIVLPNMWMKGQSSAKGSPMGYFRPEQSG